MEKQTSESFPLAITLALVGGYFDAYTYICRDHVFANAQTGNIVKFGMNLADGNFPGVVRYFIPIVAFSLGVLLTMYIRKQSARWLHWRQIILMVEIVVVVFVGLIPSGLCDIFVNVMISFICAMQVESFRKVSGTPYASTMCTGNLRSGTEYLFKAIEEHDSLKLKKCRQYFMIILFFIFGTIIGSLFTYTLVEKSIYICLFPMIIAFCMMFKKSVE